mmetsp:Transcript_32562/g.71461  ORF Transcript_32562/g.71461 Transcript_32562/m.71461 type:complete len:105 (+) Transcript_32562:509-823(+)
MTAIPPANTVPNSLVGMESMSADTVDTWMEAPDSTSDMSTGDRLRDVAEDVGKHGDRDDVTLAAADRGAMVKPDEREGISSATDAVRTDLLEHMLLPYVIQQWL